MPTAAALIPALGALLSIFVTADDPTDRGLVARRLAEAGHVVVGRGGAIHLHIDPDVIWMVSMPSRDVIDAPSEGITEPSDGMDADTVQRIELPRGAARRLVLPHHARSLVAGYPTRTTGVPVVRLSGRGDALDGVAAGLLDAGFALGWGEPVLAVCIEPGAAAIARGEDCGIPEPVADPAAYAISRARQLIRPPRAHAPRVAEPSGPVRPAVQHHASVAASTPLDLRLHVGARSERVALGGVSVERRGALRWQAGLIVDGDLAGGVRLGLGIAPADGLVLDAIAEVTAGPDGAGWRTGLALGLGQDLRVSLEPAWTDAGPSLSVSLSLALWLRP